jgi:hypothetical protein
MCMIVGVEEMDVRRGRSELAGKGAGPVAEPTHRRACRRSVPERPALGTSPCRSSSRSSVGRLAQADTPGHGRWARRGRRGVRRESASCRGVRQLREEERRRQVGRTAAGAQAAARWRGTRLLRSKREGVCHAKLRASSLGALGRGCASRRASSLLAEEKETGRVGEGKSGASHRK